MWNEEDQVLDAVPKEIEFYAFGVENINVLVPICTSVKLKYIIKNRGRYPPDIHLSLRAQASDEMDQPSE